MYSSRKTTALHSCVVTDFNQTEWMELQGNLLSRLARYVVDGIQHGKIAQDGSPAGRPWWNIYSWWNYEWSDKKKHSDWDWHVLGLIHRALKKMGHDAYLRERERFSMTGA